MGLLGLPSGFCAFVIMSIEVENYVHTLSEIGLIERSRPIEPRTVFSSVEKWTVSKKVEINIFHSSIERRSCRLQLDVQCKVRSECCVINGVRI